MPAQPDTTAAHGGEAPGAFGTDAAGANNSDQPSGELPGALQHAPLFQFLLTAQLGGVFIQLQYRTERKFGHWDAVDAAGIVQGDAVRPDIVERHVVNAVRSGMDILQRGETGNIVIAEKAITEDCFDVGEIQIIGLRLWTRKKYGLYPDLDKGFEHLLRKSLCVCHQHPHMETSLLIAACIALI